MIKVTESDRQVIEKELSFCKDEINDYLNGETISFKNVIISLEDVLDFFLSSGFPEHMRNDTRILFRK
jgi:hypothetical protein